MASTKLNIIGGFGSRILASLLSLIFVPIYLRYLSVEAYGIIGFFTIFQSSLTLIAAGFAPTLNREIARLSISKKNNQAIKDLIRTLEIPYWGITIFSGVIASLLSTFASFYWVNTNGLPAKTVWQALIIMSVGFVFQLALSLYTGGLLGLHRQFELAIAEICFAILRSLGAVFVLSYVSATVQAFLIWQAIIAVLYCLTLKLLLSKYVPQTQKSGVFQMKMLRTIWKYATGMTGLGIIAMLAGQTDKVVLSKMLSLDEFGYYVLAGMLATIGLGAIIETIITAYFPHLSKMVAQVESSNKNDFAEKNKSLKQLYHRFCQFVSVILIPISVVLAVFSYEVLSIWTRDAEITQKAGDILRIMAIGTGLNGIARMPHSLHLAFGKTKIVFVVSSIALILLIPLIIILSWNYGGIGAALAWTIINFLWILVGIPILHKYIYPEELMKWYIQDIGKPLIATLPVVLLMKFFFPNTESVFYSIILVTSASILALFFCALSLSNPRQEIKLFLKLKI